jgi:hypothetical protein
LHQGDYCISASEEPFDDIMYGNNINNIESSDYRMDASLGRFNQGNLSYEVKPIQDYLFDKTFFEESIDLKIEVE